MKGYIYGAQLALFGKRPVVGFGVDEFRVEVIDRELANATIVAHHYSGKVTMGSYIHLGVFVGDRMLGVLQYGYAMNPASQNGVVANTEIDEYLELNRMWLDDELPRNSESRAISYSIKFIREAYPKVGWIQSFADERCARFGVVYQAANFHYYGEHVGTFYELDNIWYHKIHMTRTTDLDKTARYLQDNRDRAKEVKLRQFRYVYYVKGNKIRHAQLKEVPYPKPEAQLEKDGLQ